VRSTERPPRYSSGNNAINPNRLRKNAISKVGSVFDAYRMVIAISPKNIVLASIRLAARMKREGAATVTMSSR